MKIFLKEFKDFISKGSIFDMAIGVVIGGAVNKMVSALVENILMPIVGIVMGGVDFKELSITIGQSAIKYGIFLQTVVDFLITAFCVFLIIKAISKSRKTLGKEVEKETVSTENLLVEIRDILVKKP